jgi:hypothetical protein
MKKTFDLQRISHSEHEGTPLITSLLLYSYVIVHYTYHVACAEIRKLRDDRVLIAFGRKLTCIQTLDTPATVHPSRDRCMISF